MIRRWVRLPGVADVGGRVGGHLRLLGRQLQHPLDAGERGAELVGDERDEVRLHLAHFALVRHVVEGQGVAAMLARAVPGGLRDPVEDPLQAAQLEVALRRVLLMLHQRAQGAEHAPVVRALRAVPGQHLGELVAHQVARLDREQIAGPPIGGLHAPSGGHQQHAVGRGVEDLAQAVLLEHHRLVVPRVVHRDRGVGREAREQLGFLGRELVSREVVAHQHPEHLVPHADRHREVRAGGGLDEPVVIGLVAQGRIGEPVGRAHRSALLVGASRDPFTGFRTRSRTMAGSRWRPRRTTRPPRASSWT